MRALLLIAVVGCGGGSSSGPTVITPRLAASGPPLPAPPPARASTRGAAYLDAVAAHLQPAWGQFLEDCRLRLPGDHVLNRPTLVATAELVVAEDGLVLQKRIMTGSGNGDFDTAVFDVLGDASPLPPPPRELASDDQRVHVQWTFARDGRQAGAASAQVIDLQLPLLGVVERLLATNKLVRAAQRIAAAKPDDPDRIAATEKVLVLVLKEGLASSDGSVRRAAVEAVARARVQALAPDIQPLVFPSVDLELQLLAIGAPRRSPIRRTPRPHRSCSPGSRRISRLTTASRWPRRRRWSRSAARATSSRSCARGSARSPTDLPRRRSRCSGSRRIGSSRRSSRAGSRAAMRGSEPGCVPRCRQVRPRPPRS
ncbi:MAG: TonB C-terminal domain-containing protein [Kofleriaceae bacterium]